MRHLRWAYHNGTPAPVDYRNMGPEELGSVYESLLELVPEIDLTARRWFHRYYGEGSTAGNARKTSGSYYTGLLDTAKVDSVSTGACYYTALGGK